MRSYLFPQRLKLRQREFDFVLIQTGDVTNIDSTGATFQARISDLIDSKNMKSK